MRLAVLLAACLFTAARADELPRQGGGMTIAFQDDIATLDPATGYNFQNYGLIRSIFNGLLDYEPGTTTLRPMLAESYAVSPDGLAYTFKLRPDVRFSNGRRLVADDIVYSLTRAINPKTASPGASFFGAIDGFDDFVHGRADHLRGIAAPDQATVVIRLAYPSAPFLQALALNFAFAVPREEVERPGGDFGKHPVGTGAFMLAEWKLGERLTLVRNPHFFEPGVPHLDSVAVAIGAAPLTALLQLRQGEIDVLGDDIPPAQFSATLRDPVWGGNVVQAPKLLTAYLAIKTNQKPFDDVRVRRAVEQAIDKARIVKLLNGRDPAANQILPLGMPGYDPDYKGYRYDPAAARALLREAGLAGGFHTVLYSNDTDPNPRLVQAMQQDLAAVGITAEIKTLANTTFDDAARNPADAPLAWSGVEGWSADFPDPTDFYAPILSCGSAATGGWNFAAFCRPALDRQARAADAISDPARGGERLAAWRAIFRAVMDEAAWVPILDGRFYTLKSPRLRGAQALMVDPIATPINYPYVWVDR